MKKRILLGIMLFSILGSGCSKEENKASNEYVTVEGYKGIELDETAGTFEVTDHDVDNYIESVLQQNAIEITDRAAKTGDVVNVSFSATVDGQEFQGGTGENYSFKVGEGQFLDGFDDSVTGRMPGEVYEWSGILPKDYANDPGMSGREAVYTVTVNSISELPKLTDDFVQMVSDKAKTADEYREEVRNMLKDNALEDDNTLVQEFVWNKVLEKAVIHKYPKGELADISDSLIQKSKEMAENEGEDYEAYIDKQMGISVEDFEKQTEEAAKTDIKQRLVAEVICEKEKLLPNKEELDQEYQELAEEYGYLDADAIKEAMGEETLERIVIQNRVKKWLADHCVKPGK